MEKLRRQLTTQTRNSISTLEKALKRQEEILKGIPRLKIEQEIANQKTEELKDDIYLKSIELEKLNRKIIDIDLGLFDRELETEVKTNTLEVKKAREKTEHRKKELLELKNKQELQEQRDRKQGNFKYDKSDKQKEWDYEKAYDRFRSISDTLPDYIGDNLYNMPNNKGYIFRGCWFFGKLPEERNAPIVMFERAGKGVMWIHECHPREHLIYEKKSGSGGGSSGNTKKGKRPQKPKDQKVLISRKVRKVKLNSRF